MVSLYQGVVTKPYFSEGVILLLFDLAIIDSLFPCHSITGDRMDCDVADNIIRKQSMQITNCIFFGCSIF